MNMDDNIAASINDLSLASDDTTSISACANCGKEGSCLNICNKCKAAKYCNASCKKKHRSKHKKDCEKRVTELHEEEHERKKLTAELRDKELFKQPPPLEDCPICMLPLPSLDTGRTYKPCCGKIICSGCIYAVAMRDKVEQKCPFCRTPAPTLEEVNGRMNKRAESGDAKAIGMLGTSYCDGHDGLPQDHAKALKLWQQAAELGYATSNYNIGNAYYAGRYGVERDLEKANHYWELAAMGGDVRARFSLGTSEGRNGNLDRAIKHYMIAVNSGHENSVKMIQQMYLRGHATKDDYAKALCVYQANLVEIKSVQRDKAAAADESFKYY